ncbi:MAG: 50S ribosomal protein L35 [Chloroflexi bacterium]|nr:50S ribosomal protein L35 [Chloroflexota bacterium]
MPKIKTHKGAKARIRITGNGKFLRMKIGRSHFRRRKTKRGERALARPIAASTRFSTALRRMLPGD